MKNIICQSEIICKCFMELGIYRLFSQTVIKHMMTIVIASLSLGYKGKTVNYEKYSSCHRTTIAHYLNEGVWDDEKLRYVVKAEVIERIYSESIRSGMPVYCFVDDTVSSKTKPSSQALHPIEDAYFHYSHLKRKQDYGHQAMAVMLSCNGTTLNYDIVMYDKTKSKIQLLQEIAKELPAAPIKSYFMCGSWYTSAKVINAFAVKGFYTIGALKTNRVIYPCGIKIKVSEFAIHIRKTDKEVRLVTVGSRQYYVYRYEGCLNGLENAVVLITYPKDAFHNPKALRAFVCTDVSLSTEEILDIYTERWKIEVFFRNCKSKLALDKYQIRSSKGIKRYWLIMSLVHLLCCTGNGKNMTFQEGYYFFEKELRVERIIFFYQCGFNRVPLDKVLSIAG